MIDEKITPAAEAWGLSAPEYQVLWLHSRGFSTSEICDIGGISAASVHRYSHAINQKLGATTRCHAVYLAMKRGIL